MRNLRNPRRFAQPQLRPPPSGIGLVESIAGPGSAGPLSCRSWFRLRPDPLTERANPTETPASATCRLAHMSTISVPDELARRLEAAAVARGTTADALATELLEGHVLDDIPPSRRSLRLIGIGASDGGTSDRIDELLAGGFGRS